MVISDKLLFGAQAHYQLTIKIYISIFSRWPYCRWDISIPHPLLEWSSGVTHHFSNSIWCTFNQVQLRAHFTRYGDQISWTVVVTNWKVCRSPIGSFPLRQVGNSAARFSSTVSTSNWNEGLHPYLATLSMCWQKKLGRTINFHTSRSTNPVLTKEDYFSCYIISAINSFRIKPIEKRLMTCGRIITAKENWKLRKPQEYLRISVEPSNKACIKPWQILTVV